MNPGDQHRIAKRHLERNAVVYVRQSDPRQVRENAESTLLQRGLREKAVEMGWSMPKLVEDDLGITASGFADRPGFQWMLTQVTLRKVGIIFCMDASRLSRNSSDWAHLFELCGYFDTLVADVQQVYDVSVPNDRLVLQIKGTVAELELSSLRTRLRHRPEVSSRSCCHPAMSTTSTTRSSSTQTSACSRRSTRCLSGSNTRPASVSSR